MKRLFASMAFVVSIIGASPVHAQRVTLDAVRLGDTTVVHVLRLRDGSQLVGHVVAVTTDSVQMALRSGRITIARGDVTEVRELPQSLVRDGEVWFPNPHSTRLLFAPTAFPMEKGAGYFSDIYLFLVSVQYGFTERFSLGAGMSVFPTENFADNLFYLTPKLTVYDAPELKLSLGAFLGVAGLASNEFNDGSGSGNSLGILYGVASTGTRESNLSLGLGWGYLGNKLANKPAVMIGGQGRVSKRVSLVSENWVVSTDSQTEGVVSYGVRFLGDRISVDLAFLNPLDGQKYFPGIPFVGFAIRY